MGCCTIPTPKRPPAKPSQSQAALKTEDVKLEEVKFQKQQFIKQQTGKVEEKYRYVRQLGKGTFGTVFYATDRESNANRAIKVIPKNKRLGSTASEIKNEVELLKRLDHPNIVQIYEVYESLSHFYLVTEYCQGGELFDFIVSHGNLSEVLVAKFMHQILSAVAYCHSQGVVHRDLKPENLLLESKSESPSIKVADFGTSTIFSSRSRMNERLGTPYYIAPEVLKQNYDEKCDVWSCGVILYILLSGEPPFNSRIDKEIYEKVLAGKYSTSHGVWAGISAEAKNLVNRLLVYNPQERTSALEALQDPWLQHAVALEDRATASSVTETLQNLKGMHTFKKLQQGVRSYIASQFISDQERRDLTKVFKNLDTNGDGRLSREELIAGYSKTMSEAEAMTTVDDIMRYVDTDKNGYIEYTEFVAATMQFKDEHAKKVLKRVFKAFDRDGSGKISASEVKQILGDDSDSIALWDGILKLGDVNGDGEIDIQEFEALLTGLNLSS